MKLLAVQRSGLNFVRLASERMGKPIDFSHHTDYVDSIGTGPLVIAVRDPMLGEISRVNNDFGADIREWLKIATLWKRARTLWFRTDAPLAERPAEMAALKAFISGLRSDSDWTPVWTSKDRLAIKPRYARGEIPPEVRPAFLWLRDAPAAAPVRTLFGRLGYALPWMS